MVIPQGKEEQRLDSKDLKVYHKTRASLCWREDNKVVNDITNHRGKDGISHHEFNWYNGKARNTDDDHDTFVERFHEDVIDRRWHQVKRMMKRKVIGTMVRTQTRNQVCCSRWNDMTMQIDASLAHHWKLCSGNKDQVARLNLAW